MRALMPTMVTALSLTVTASAAALTEVETEGAKRCRVEHVCVERWTVPAHGTVKGETRYTLPSDVDVAMESYLNGRPDFAGDLSDIGKLYCWNKRRDVTFAVRLSMTDEGPMSYWVSNFRATKVRVTVKYWIPRER